MPSHFQHFPDLSVPSSFWKSCQQLLWSSEATYCGIETNVRKFYGYLSTCSQEFKPKLLKLILYVFWCINRVNKLQANLDAFGNVNVLLHECHGHVSLPKVNMTDSYYQLRGFRNNTALQETASILLHNSNHALYKTYMYKKCLRW